MPFSNGHLQSDRFHISALGCVPVGRDRPHPKQKMKIKIEIEILLSEITFFFDPCFSRICFLDLGCLLVCCAGCSNNSIQTDLIL